MSKRIDLIKYVFAVCCLVLSLSYYSYAEDDDITDKQIEQHKESLDVNAMEEKRSSLPEELGIMIFADLQQGYDNNVELSSARLKDGFVQGSTTLELDYASSEFLEWKLGADIFETTYYNYNKNNLLDISPFFGLDWEIMPGFIFKNKLAFDYFLYPNNKDSTFIALIGSTYLRHYILKELYHELGYEYTYRWYTKRKISLPDNSEGDNTRKDDRSKLKYNIGYFVSDNLFVKLSNEFVENDSNDRYQNYYDYWYYRVKPSVMYFFNDELYTSVSYSYRFLDYADRRNTEDGNSTVSENTHMFNAAFYYDINKNFTVGVTYSYSENFSNDPFQKYSGSVISGGVYYTY